MFFLYLWPATSALDPIFVTCVVLKSYFFSLQNDLTWLRMTQLVIALIVGLKLNWIAYFTNCKPV